MSSPDPLAVRSGETTVAVRPAERALLVERDGETLLSGSLALAGEDSGPSLEPDADVLTVQQSPTRARVAYDDPWRTTVTLRAAQGGDGGVVDVDVSFENPRLRAVSLDDLALLEDAETTFGGDASVFWHGYQSWTPTATLPVGERFAPEPDEQRPQMRDLAAPRDSSHGVVGFVPEIGPEAALTLGFLDHERFVSRFDVVHDSAGVVAASARCPGDGRTLQPGETLELPTLRVDATHSLDDALAGVADAVADRMDARVPDAAPTGWCSWYHYFTDVTAADVRENVAAVDDWTAPLDVVQVDDGYQTAFGDWTTLADGFDDPAGLFADVAAAGHTPGLWLAPFYVQADADLATDHPEWLVTADGDPVSATPRHGPMYALDATHPEVETWLRETFETIVAEWGVEYLKLDFLYAAALPGERHDETATRAEAYRRGLETIRETVGDDVTVLGCGAPQFQSVGLVDAMRVGPDTAPYWRDSPESKPAHENAVRNVLNRQWTHRRLWANDPDCQLVRETTALAPAERRSFAAIVGLLGGTNVVSDRVAEIGAAGRALLERSLPPVTNGTVRDLGERALPRRVVAVRDAVGALAVAAFNWTDEPRTVRVDPAEHGREGARVWDVWRDADAGTGAFEREVPPHGCVLCHVAAPGGHPRLFGSEHLGNLASQVTAVEWLEAEGSDRSGTLRVVLDAERSRRLSVVVPGDWTATGEPAIETLDASPGENEIEFEDRRTS